MMRIPAAVNFIDKYHNDEDTRSCQQLGYFIDMRGEQVLTVEDAWRRGWTDGVGGWLLTKTHGWRGWTDGRMSTL